MAIKKFYSNKAKVGWRWEAGKKQYYSWGLDIRLASGKRLREPGFASRELAEAAGARIRLSEINRKYELVDLQSFPTLRELANRRLATVSDHAERVRSERVLNVLSDCLATKGLADPKINELTTAAISVYVEHRHQEKVKDETINRELRIIAATLNQAKHFFPNLEDWHPPRVRFVKVEKTRRERVVNSGEARSILYYLLKPQGSDESKKIFLSRRRAGLLFILSAVTGARPGELLRLSEQDILTDLNVLKITGRKTRFKKAKTVRYFPLIDVVKTILKEGIEIRAGEFIFSKKGTITETYYKQIRNACEFAGVTYGRKVRGGLIPYDLRHTATTLIAQSGADMETLSSITGHSHHSLWHYTHASNESIGRAVSVLERFASSALEAIPLSCDDGGLSLDTVQSVGNASLLN